MKKEAVLSGGRGLALKKAGRSIKTQPVKKIRGMLWPIFRFLLLLGLSFVIIYPFLSKISSMFMSLDDQMDPTVWMVPRNATLSNINLVLKYGQYWEAFGNTLLISTICAVLQTFICTVVGYGFAKFKFRDRGVFFVLVILTIIIPPQTIYISLYMKFRYFDIFGLLKLLGAGPVKLVESVAPMGLLSVTALGLKNGLYIFVMRQFFRGVPKELNEAAWVDGCGPIASYFRIMIKMAVPMMISVFMLSFSWQWTDTFYSELFYRKMVVLPTIFPKVITIAGELITKDSMMSKVKPHIPNGVFIVERNTLNRHLARNERGGLYKHKYRPHGNARGQYAVSPVYNG